MTYLDHGATSFPKPQAVTNAMVCAQENCANPGRGGYREAMNAAQLLLRCRERAGELFDCDPEQVVLTTSCTHGLNLAIRTLVKPGSRVVISGFEHNAVTRPLHGLHARITVAGRKLFDREDTLRSFENALQKGADAAVFTHVSNVFGYILPVEELASLCKKYRVPFIVDCAQSAGRLPVSLRKWDADFIAMPGHKGLLGPMGTGLLLCKNPPQPLIYGGTGSQSESQQMPAFLPDVAEAGTANVPGFAGLCAGLETVRKTGIERLLAREQTQARRLIKHLEKYGYRVFSGEDQCGTVSFVPDCDTEELAQFLAGQDIAVRAGLHCAPLAHESAGTLQTGTVRVSFGHNAAPWQTGNLQLALGKFAQKQQNFSGKNSGEL